MSMLSGFIPPTSGDAIIAGKNISRDITKVQKVLGICPQHDVLFAALTAYEHLWFFSKLKGYHSSNLKTEIKNMLNDVGFGSNYNQLVSDMSAGQKRSLSVGIALMGDSKVVILDEPSSGMDPSTRRNTWDILMKHRHERTMLLSTHYMDEADALGDRIAIMAKGELQCCGSSMFLKKAYGAGLRLLVYGNENMDYDRLSKMLESYVPDFRVEYETVSSICFLLPETSTAAFPKLFEHLNENKDALGIENFGTKTTTMEEVFLKSEHQKYNQDMIDIKYTSRSPNVAKRASTELRNAVTNMHYTGFQLTLNRIKAQLMKRYIVSRRNPANTAGQYILPPIFYLFFLFVNMAMIENMVTEKEPLMLDIDIYKKITHVLMFNESCGLNSKMTSILNGKKFRHHIETVPTTHRSNVGFTNFFLSKYKDGDGYYIDRLYLVGAQFYENVAVNETGCLPNGSNVPGVKVLYNGEAFHTMFIANQLALNTFIHHFFNTSYNIQTGLYPLPKKGETELITEYVRIYKSGFFVGFFLGIGFCIYSALAVHYVLKERLSGVKHMHAMFGVGLLTYWIPTFLWDLMGFIPPITLLFFIFHTFEREAPLNNWWLVLVIFALYAWASLPTNYAMQSIFQSASSGLVGCIILNLFGVLLSNVVVNEFNNPKSTNKNAAKLLDIVFASMIPSYALSQCFNFNLKNYETRKMCAPYQEGCRTGHYSLCCANHPVVCNSTIGGECFVWNDSIFGFGIHAGIGHYIIIMICQGVLGSIFILVTEIGPGRVICCMDKEDKHGWERSPCISQRESQSFEQRDTDTTVEEEKLRVCSMNRANSDTSVLVVGLTKRYGNTKAVDNLYFSVTEGHCLGLLGQSGAGKTTLLRMLTGQTIVTHGNAYLHGHSVRSELRTCQEFVGYCPQYDAHVPEMTAFETLTFFAMLRGIQEHAIKPLIEHMISWVMIEACAMNKCGTYSGGNRRKLSLAIALVGDPRFLLLDEPSSGMDPKARRQMWNVLNEIRMSGRTIIMTTHSMDECEALSTKLAIMMRGRLLCMGTIQHLKAKYGQGYTIIIKVGSLPGVVSDGDQGKNIIKFMIERLPDTKLFDQHPGYLHLQIPNKDVNIGDVFNVMEDCKTKLQIEDYSVNETTLEQIFLAFTKSNKLQETPKEDDVSCWNLQSGFFDDRFYVCGLGKKKEMD